MEALDAGGNQGDQRVSILGTAARPVKLPGPYWIRLMMCQP